MSDRESIWRKRVEQDLARKKFLLERIARDQEELRQLRG